MFSKCFHFRNNTDVELAFGKRKKKGEKEEKKKGKMELACDWEIDGLVSPVKL